MNDNQAETKQPKVFGFIGHCPVKGCKCARRLDIQGALRIKRDRWNTWSVTEPVWPSQYEADIYCPIHKRRFRWDKVNGSFSEKHQCDSRCLCATGHNCECSCGGANHGAAYR